MGDDKAPLRRAGTVYGQRNEDRKSRPLGVPIIPAVPVGEFVDPEQQGTGVTEGEALARVRGNRETKDRLHRLENKSDEDRAAIARLDASVGRLEGRFDGLDGKLDILVAASERNAERETVTYTETVKRETAREVSGIQVDTAQKLDVIDARKAKRTLAAKIVGLLGAGSAIAELVHWIAGKL